MSDLQQAISRDPAVLYMHGWKHRWPVLGLVLLCLPMLYWSITSASVRLARPFPQSPWESQILTDAMCVSRGEPVYTNPREPSGHATHMYGPLITYSVGWIFKLTGFQLTASRWIALVSAVCIAVFLSVALTRKQGAAVMLIAATLFFYQFYRGRAYFAEARPDCVSIAFSIVALWMMFKAHRDHLIWLAPAMLLMLIAFFFKQTSAAVAGVPLVYVLMLRPRPFRSQMIHAVVPLLVMAACVLGIRLAMPNLYFHLFVVPAQFSLQPWRWPSVMLDIAMRNLFFVALLTLWLSGWLSIRYSRQTTLWCIAIAIIAVLSSVLAVAKYGGAENSHIPAYLSLAVLSAGLMAQWKDEASNRARHIGAAVLLLAFASDAWFLHAKPSWYNPGPANGDKNYARVIMLASQLEGVVLCPDDPTISLLAKNQHCRNVVCEMDTTGQQSIPDVVLSEWAQANYIIRVQGMWTSLVPADQLTAMGFKRINEEGFTSGSYSLWKRSTNLSRSTPSDEQEIAH